MRFRLPWRAAMAGACAAGLLASASWAQDSTRRAGDERTPEADAKRQRAFSRFLMARTRSVATLEIGDSEILAHSGKIATSHADYAAIDETAVGDVVAMTSAAAMKLRSEVDLSFDGVAVATGNVADGYAGTYALWLKRTASGWSLVFNNEADVWGTQRDPAHDAAEVPLAYERVEGGEDELAVSLSESEGGGILGLSWGPHRWTAAFRVGS